MSHHKRYKYKHYWVEVFIEVEGDRFSYYASIELPEEGGVIDTQNFPTLHEAEVAAAKLIDKLR